MVDKSKGDFSELIKEIEKEGFDGDKLLDELCQPKKPRKYDFLEISPKLFRTCEKF